MNFLGHFILAHPDPDLMIGNYLGDLIHKRDEAFLDERFHKGLRFHRFIDYYTDHHASVDEMNRLLRPAVGKYAPVATDIVMDYFIHWNWNDLQKISYSEFSSQVYQLLEEHLHHFPDQARDLTKRMMEGYWLNQYSSIEGMEDVMKRMNRKAKFSVDFTSALSSMQLSFEKYNELFLCFIQDIRSESQYWLNLQNEEKS